MVFPSTNIMRSDTAKQTECTYRISSLVSLAYFPIFQNLTHIERLSCFAFSKYIATWILILTRFTLFLMYKDDTRCQMNQQTPTNRIHTIQLLTVQLHGFHYNGQWSIGAYGDGPAYASYPHINTFIYLVLLLWLLRHGYVIKKYINITFTVDWVYGHNRKCRWMAACHGMKRAHFITHTLAICRVKVFQHFLRFISKRFFLGNFMTMNFPWSTIHSLTNAHNTHCLELGHISHQPVSHIPSHSTSL